MSELLSKTMQDSLKAASLAPKIDIPALRLDYSTLFPDLTSVHKEIARSALSSIRAYHDLQRAQFADIIAKARVALRSALPPN